MKIGIIGAMGCEVSSIQESIINSQTEVIAKMEFTFGVVSDVFVVAVVCGIGKVNASIGTGILINHFNVDYIINIGTAGAADKKLNVGDIVISDEAIYHDYDSRQLMRSYPKMENENFKADVKLYDSCLQRLQGKLGKSEIYIGKVASGDRFISDFDQKEKIHSSLSASCIDCEGAAIAHVSYVYKIPFVLIKVISDKADEEASISFREFLQHVPDMNKEIFKIIIRAIK